MKQRARLPADKELRRGQLVDAARVLLDGGGTSFTMAEVAAGAGLAKGTTYLYFPTREALLLAVLQQDLAGWFQALAEALPAAASADGGVARALAASLLARPRLLLLLGDLHAVLEQNLDHDVALAFKQFLAASFAEAEGLAPALGLAPGEAPRFFLRLHAFVVGLVGMTRPNPVMDEVLARPELAGLRVDRAAELEAGARVLLAGMKA